jgi:hypothetical protein
MAFGGGDADNKGIRRKQREVKQRRCRQPVVENGARNSKLVLDPMKRNFINMSA